MCEKHKIEIELKKAHKLKIDIISKAFNMNPKEFINFVLKEELRFIKNSFNFSYPKENLEDYYKFNINIDELRKLNLVGEIL